jgi:hypothetical protein
VQLRAQRRAVAQRRLSAGRAPGALTLVPAVRRNQGWAQRRPDQLGAYAAPAGRLIAPSRRRRSHPAAELRHAARRGCSVAWKAVARATSRYLAPAVRSQPSEFRSSGDPRQSGLPSSRAGLTARHADVVLVARGRHRVTVRVCRSPGPDPDLDQQGAQDRELICRLIVS